jgi:hypothetical protein
MIPISNSYKEFLEGFANLSAYEVDHLCKCIFEQYLTLIENTQKDLSVKEVRHILSEGMKKAHLHLAHKQVEQAKMELNLLQNKYGLSSPSTGKAIGDQ